MFDAVNAYLEARRHTPQGIVAWEAWEYGNVVERDSPLLKSLSGGFGVTEADLDGVFHEAAALSA